MPQLSPGAVRLPMHHVSVRVPWNDTGWTGHVCANPAANHSCTALTRIKQAKEPIAEQACAGQSFDEVEAGPPPCVWERGGFMRSTVGGYTREHPYRKNKPYSHFIETRQQMAPFSLEVTPFRWMLAGECDRYKRQWGIEIDRGREESITSQLDFEPQWMQDHRNQLALLDSFFSALRPRRSLVLLYAKDLPLVEDREPGARYLIGAGFVDAVEPFVEWSYSSLSPGDVRSVLWERGVAHSIRSSSIDGFLLPYQQLLNDPALSSLDLAPFVARAPTEHFDEFSYASELVSQDGAIAALGELARVVELLPEAVDGSWEQVGRWIGDRLVEVWHARGPYPGIGSVLAAAGLARGPLLACQVLDSLPSGSGDPWPAVEDAIANNVDGLVGRTSRKAWEKLTPERYRQIRLMSRFALSVQQARELFDGLVPEIVLDNPYALYEADCSEPVSFTTVDRGLWPQDADARIALAADPIDDPVDEPSDDRRVRAASIHVLEAAAERGHSLLDEASLRKQLADLELQPPCDPNNSAWDIACDMFRPLMVARGLARDAGRGWQLERLGRVTDLIAAEIRSRSEMAPLDVDWNWAGRVDRILPRVENPDVAERRARAEKTMALEVIARCRISALVGPAGTGKTTILEALCADPAIDAGGVLLLAPTGKATVQLQARTGKGAQNLAQFLRVHKRWDWDSGNYYLAPDQGRYMGAKTVIIDESSMLTEEMLAATLDALSGVERLILCGDPRQLPPIGPGRPFADIVSFLGGDDGPAGGIAELRTGRRQVVASDDGERLPDDVAIASLFSLDAPLSGAEEALDRVLAGDGDGRIEIHTWRDEADLHVKVIDALLSERTLGLDTRKRGAICRSFGAECEDEGLPRFPWGAAGVGAENWQLLSPVRARSGGTSGLNELIRNTWRAGDVRLAQRSYKFQSPAGADQIIFADKVMCVRNDNRRRATDPATWQIVPGGVANGEIGIVVKHAGKKPAGHVVEFSTQLSRQYAFWANELNSEDDGGEWLELAYAVTVHKSQGSQFKVTVVVLPDPCPLLSPELIYTALTRQQDKVIVFKQGEAAALRDLASPGRSETARRLTCLLRPTDPFVLSDGTVVDGSHVHRTARGDDLVRSKSEVIVADALHDLGVDYGYEVALAFPGEMPRRPDFTIPRPGTTPVYWEHLGMLDLSGYRADWEARKAWYASHGILPWDEGGGPAGTLVCSVENVGGEGISSHDIRKLAQHVFGSG
jgi:hypothetical protein